MRSPLTSTHRSTKEGTYLRITNREYADIYQPVHAKWFPSTVTNLEILVTNRLKYVKLLHTGFERTMANFFQWATGSVYRIKKIKIY